MQYAKAIVTVLCLFPLTQARALGENADVGKAFTSKILCSAVFVGGRSASSAVRDLGGYDPRLSKIKYSVNYGQKCISTWFLFPRNARTACYEPGIGCRSLNLGYRVPVRDEVWKGLPEPKAGPDLFTKGPAEVASRVGRAVDTHFRSYHGTRALVVLRKDQLVAEQYAPGFPAETRHQGWSMSKTVAAALLGIRARQGKLSLDQANFFAAWAKDSRARIRLRDLLNMSSGLHFYENYDDNFSDVVTMLYQRSHMASFAVGKHHAYEPGSKWSYSTGTTAILHGVLRNTFDSVEDYWRFPYAELFNKIGATSFLLEMDAGGTYVGGANTFATARDWARLGSVFLHRGKAGDETIFDESWYDFLVSAAPAAPQGKYGGQLWTNLGTDGKGTNRPWPNLPPDAFAFEGHRWQNVLVVPSQALVVVRLGHTYPETSWSEDMLAPIVREAR